MDFKNILSFIAFASLLAFIPGPDILFVLTQSLTKGRQIGIYITIGLCSGLLIHTAAAASGLSVLIYAYLPAFWAVKILGALYLLYLAYGAYFETNAMTEFVNQSEIKAINGSSFIKKGFWMNVLNPKVSLFFVALLPQFITPNAWPTFAQLLILGFTFMLVSFVIFAAIAFVGGRFSTLLSKDRFWKTCKWLKISVFTLIALKLLF